MKCSFEALIYCVNGVNSPPTYKSLDWHWWNNGNTKTKTEKILKSIFTECDSEKKEQLPGFFNNYLTS